MGGETCRRALYALETADKLARDGERGTWLSVKQSAWLRSAITEAVLAGAHGDLGGPEHVWSLRCAWNTHTLATLYVAPNHAGLVKRAPDCDCV